MKLYDILQRHAGPKSQVEFTRLRVLADSEQQILDRLNSKDGPYTYGVWTEREEFDEDAHDADEQGQDGKRLFNIYDEHYKVIGRETYLERMLRLRGEFNDEDANFDDAYYGIKHYGWSEGVEITAEDLDVLKRFVTVEDWRVEAAS